MKADIDRAPSETTHVFGASADDLREQVRWSLQGVLNFGYLPSNKSRFRSTKQIY